MTLKHLIILGPDIQLTKEVKDAYQDPDCLIIGDGSRFLTKEEIATAIRDKGGIDRDTKINIFGHGAVRDGNHSIDILDPAHSPESSTRNLLSTIADIAKSQTGEPFDLEIYIYSCFSGAAAKDVEVLSNKSFLLCNGTFDEKTLIGSANNTLLHQKTHPSSSMVRNIFTRAIHHPQGMTIGIKDGDGISSTLCLRDTIPDFISTEGHSRYYHRFWGGQIKDAFRDKADKLPDKFRADDIPNIDFIKEFVENNITCYRQMKIDQSFFNKSNSITTKLLDKLDSSIPENKEYLERLIYSTCTYDNKEIFNYLLEKGTNPFIIYKGGKSLLHEACATSSRETVERLLDSGLDIELLNNNNMTPLHHACLNENIGAIKALKARGADLEKPNKIGFTALHYGCAKNNLVVVETLLEGGVAVNTRNKMGITPLFLACGKGKLDIIKALIDKGADVDAECNGKKPLDQLNEEAKKEIEKHIREKIVLDSIASISVSATETKLAGMGSSASPSYSATPRLKFQNIVKKVIHTNRLGRSR